MGIVVGAAFLVMSRADGELKSGIPTEWNIERYVQNLNTEQRTRWELYTIVAEEGLRYKDFALLVRIAKAESGFSQFEKDGETVRYGRVNKNDRGLFQINSRWHKKPCADKGWDIETADGNMRCAIALYKREGTKPWNWSKAGWK
ncbi:hypothetical protein HY346_03305 [Candidatus Microgenomates bacterium]|nr:hypothetical protein [Candidatus Microgenomates bacterium]